jgi:CRISPR/Cas system-associated protein endoribonuclease Cas2
MQSVREGREQKERQRLKKKPPQQANIRMLRPQEAQHLTQMQALEQE